MTVFEIDPLSDARWDSFIKSHPSASIFHTVGWLDSLRRAYGYQPVVVTTSPPGCDLTNGVAFCHLRSWITGKRIVSLPFSDHCHPLTENSEELVSLLNYMKDEAHRTGSKYIELRPVDIGVQSPFEVSQRYCLHRLDLRIGAEQVFRHFHHDCIQRKIRRAEREHLEIEHGSNPRIVKQFYRLVTRTRRRQGLPPQPMWWFATLVACLGPGLTIHIASKNDEPIAGILTLEHNRSVVYKYGASDERFHNLGGMVCLFWHAIQKAIGRGFTEFDMGRSDLVQEGLIRFKEHWGATRSNLCYWRYPATRVVHATRVTQIARQLLSVLPDYPLQVAGSFLYRHMG